MEIELRPHPSQARNPVTDEPLFNEDGSAVALFPDLRSIWIDGQMVGFTGDPPARSVLLIARGIPEVVVAKIKSVVCDEFDLDEIEKVASPAEGVLNDGEE